MYGGSEVLALCALHKQRNPTVSARHNQILTINIWNADGDNVTGTRLYFGGTEQSFAADYYNVVLPIYQCVDGQFVRQTVAHRSYSADEITGQVNWRLCYAIVTVFILIGLDFRFRLKSTFLL